MKNQFENIPRASYLCAILNVPPVVPGTRLTRPGHMTTPICNALYFRGQFRELTRLIVLCGGHL